jgi:hypothetical protein
MASRTGRHLVALASFALAIPVSSRASADVPRSACVQANLSAQEQRRADHFAAARAALATCADPSCPAVIRHDCGTRLEELARVQPSLVFDVKDEKGADLVDVTVTLDGQTLGERLDGKPVDVDPGPHVLRFDAPGRSPISQQLLVNEGDARRRAAVVLVPMVGPLVAPAAPALAENGVTLLVDGDHPVPPAPARGLGTKRIAGIATAGAGVILVGLGAAFGAGAISAWDGAKSVCGGDASRCNSATNAATASGDHGTAETDAAVSTTAFVAGGVFVAAGVALFFMGGPRDASAQQTGWTLAPSVASGRAGLHVLGSF